jgi:hypothetical protein
MSYRCRGRCSQSSTGKSGWYGGIAAVIPDTRIRRSGNEVFKGSVRGQVERRSGNTLQLHCSPTSRVEALCRKTGLALMCSEYAFAVSAVHITTRKRPSISRLATTRMVGNPEVEPAAALLYLTLLLETGHALSQKLNARRRPSARHPESQRAQLLNT